MRSKKPSADAGYAAAEWGERIYDPKYRNPEWK
jgi:hypothetical protein